MTSSKFATSINCIDGRVQLPISNWIKKNHSVDFVDTITEPGSDKALSEGTTNVMSQIKSKVLISINAHGSKLVIVSGHNECAANPVTREAHIEQIQKSVEIVKSWKLPVTIIGLWVNEQWEIEQI